MVTVGRYQLLETLGEGGMGVVYKAFDPLLERTVAVKLISARLDDSPSLRQRFFAEARAAGQLSHKNIVTIFDLGEDNGHPYFAMEFLEGRNLRMRMQSPERMSLHRKLEVMTQVCEGLAYAHSRGITHRDVKPANIFITEAGQVKVLDFGLARLPASELTHSKTLIGTLNYMAPEQIAGEKTDQRTDIFSVGVVFYELLTSKSPFEADSVASLLHKILHELPEPLGALDPRIPPELSALVERAMAKAREERYQGLVELLIDLADCRARLRASDPGSGAVARGVGANTPSPSALGAGSAGSAPGESAGSSASPSSPSSPSSSSIPSSLGGSRGSKRILPVSRRTAALAVSVVLAVTLFAGGMWLQSRPVGAGADGAPAEAPSVATTPEPPGSATGAASGQPREAEPPAAPVVPPPQVPPPPRPEATVGRGSGSETAPPPGATRSRRDRDSARQGNAREAAPGGEQAERGRTEAETARAAMSTAKANADGARANELAPAAYNAALAAQAAALQLFDARQFAPATVKLYEASGLFRRADIEARAEQARQAEAAREEEDRREQARRAEQARAARESTAPPAPEVPRFGGAPTVPGAAAGGRGDASPAGAHDAAAAEKAIREVLSRYAAALEARSLGALERVWPGLSGGQKRAIREEFEGARSISVALSDPVVEVAGNTATVTCQRHYVLDTRDGHHLEHRNTSVLTLRRSNGAWVIDGVKHGGGR